MKLTKQGASLKFLHLAVSITLLTQQTGFADMELRPMETDLRPVTSLSEAQQTSQLPAPVEDTSVLQASLDFLSEDSPLQPVTKSITLSNPPAAAPELVLSIGNGSGFVRNGIMTVHLSAQDSGPAISRFRWRRGAHEAWSDWMTYTESFEVDNWGPEGTRYVQVHAQDAAGNDAWAFSSVLLDTVPPAVTAAIHDGTGAVNNGLMTVHLSAQDSGSGISRFRWRRGAHEAWSNWTNYTESFQIDNWGPDGTRYVQIHAEDAAGNETWAFASALLDTVPPTVSASMNNNAAAVNNGMMTVRLSAQDIGSGISRFRWRRGAHESWSNWTAYTETFAVDNWGPDGTRFIQVHAQDAAGNDAWAFDSIQLDTVPPDAFTLSPSIVNSANYSLSYEVTDSLDAARTVTETPVTLSVGINTLTRTVTDAAGNTRSFSQTVDYVPVTNLWQPYGASHTNFNWITTTLPTDVVGDNVSRSFSLPFSFKHFDQNYSQIHISSNGFVELGGCNGCTASSPESIPSYNYPNAIIAPFWRNLVADTSSVITYSSTSERFAVSWNNIRSYGSFSNLLKFQLILNKDGSIVFQYDTVSGGYPTVIGIENGLGTAGIQHTPIPANRTAIRFTPNTSWNAALAINQNQLQTSSADVTLSLTGNPPSGEITAMRFSTDGGTTWSGWERFAAEKSFRLPGAEGVKTIQVQLRDRFGASVSLSKQILYAPTSPSISFFETLREVRKTINLGPLADALGQTISYSVVGSLGLLANGSFSIVRNQLSYFPSSGFTGLGTVTVQASSAAGTSTQTFGFNILEPEIHQPNDPFLPLQYGLESLDVLRAWNLSRGQGVTVAVLDSGISWQHSDLAENIAVNEAEIAGDGLDNDGNGFVDDVRGWDFANSDNNPFDDFGHGTHVAGIIGATAGNSLGGSGVAPDSELLGIKIAKITDVSLDDVFSRVAQAIRYAVQQGARVINMSIGTLSSDLNPSVQELMRQAIAFARQAGVILVAASGNEDKNTDLVTPGGMEGIITVGAADSAGNRASFSNYGSTLDVMAPGVDVVSTFLNNGYLIESGTSMAAPHVSGLIALLLAQDPNATEADVLRRLRFSSLDMGAPGFDILTGYGQVNAFRALSYDYYDTGVIRSQWLERPDENGWNRLFFDETGYLTGGLYVPL